MVNSISTKILNDPVSVIRNKFEEAVLDQRPNATADYGVPELFEAAFEEAAEVNRIPLLRALAAREQTNGAGKLFRVICYVTHSDSEIFGGAYRTHGKWHLGRYGLDALQVDAENVEPEELVFEERTSLQCRLLDLSHSQSLEESMRSVSLEAGQATNAQDLIVKLYNEKEEGLLHACLDVVGVLDVVGTELVLHSLITKNQRLSSLVSDLNPMTEPNKNPAVRADLVRTLSDALQGDALAAELTLLNLCSGVSMRSPILVGPLTLNLRGVSSEVAKQLTTVISDLAANTFTFDMSIDNLNKARLYPSHDGEAFSSGELQLPTDTSIILNESALSEGQLDERGVKNLKCLSNTMTTQDLIFHFPFSEFKIPVDLSFLTLSHGKSLLPSTISIGMRQASASMEGSAGSTTTTKSEMRTYLSRCRLQEAEISEEVSGRIQEDFVGRRKDGRERMEEGDLSMSLALGKEVTKSHGRRRMTWEDYVSGQNLHSQIKQRT